MFSRDMNNLILAGFCNMPAMLLAFEKTTLITVISAIVLPCLFFLIGKTVDVFLQIHFKNREKRNDQDKDN
jgi:hypothetical protein